MWVSGGKKIDEDDREVFGVKESAEKLQRDACIRDSVSHVLETVSLTSKIGRYIN